MQNHDDFRMIASPDNKGNCLHFIGNFYFPIPTNLIPAYQSSP